ncbi:MAG: amidohydrolase, partial [Anaerolineae bacterium]|nr:amidohydrolase [Anaerolineae bacterium]
MNPSQTLSRARAMQDWLSAHRRAFHMYPELGFQELRTAERVADALRAMDLQVQTGVGNTGVVARLGEGPPAVGLRAEMDALEVREVNNVPYASQRPGLMHACGHDGHMAMLLGAAELLRTMKGRPRGEVRFLFQPCEEAWDEEGKGGALRLVEAGVLEGLAAVIALHVDPGAPAGMVGIRSGPAMAAVDPWTATIRGAGCHSSAPEQGLSPIYLLTQVVSAIQAVPALRVSPLQPAIVSVESVHAGGTTGVIPEQVTLSGNIRSYDEETRRRLWDELERALGLARALGGDYTLEIRSYYPACHNDSEITALLRRTAEEMIGAERVYLPDLEMAGEDFAYLSREVPGVLFRLGVSVGDVDRPLHSPLFDLDEAALPLGAALLAET